MNNQLPARRRRCSQKGFASVKAVTAGSIRLAVTTLAVLGLVTSAALPAVAQAPANHGQAAVQTQPGQGNDKELGDADRARVAEAQAAGKRTVTLLVAAERDQLATATKQLRALGGVVRKTDDAVDYVKVDVPVGNVERAAKLGSVSALDVDGLIPLDDPRPDGTVSPTPQQPPDQNTPRINPYMPINDTRAAQFVLDNPQWDGRGVKVAIMDTGVDLHHPALSTTSTGAPKVIDWYNANATNSGDNTWVRTSGRHTGSFDADGRTWTAPDSGGPYAFGLFREAAGDLLSGEPQGDINRDGDTADSFGVLQDTVSKRVFVDVDQDGDFTDEPGMIDFKVDRDVRFFGTDSPATDVVEQVPFVVVTDRSDYSTDASWVNIGIAAAAHGTHVAGIATGSGLFGGQMAGAAPGAQVISVKVCLATPACTSSGMIDGLLYAAHAGAEVVNISIGGLPALNDGNNARAELYNRTIDEFNMQIFNSAGNSGAGANTVGDPAVATRSMAVGSSITAASWRSNYGSEPLRNNGLHPFSSRGPREDGGLKPQIVAPGSAVSSTPRWQPGQAVGGTYQLPAGYGMFNGTSMAAPQATGAAAVLISAYKATFGGHRPTAAALRSAIMSGAFYQSDLAAYEQGAGMFWVPTAWQQLRSGQRPHAITSAVPVNTVLADQLATPNVGVGIHDREGTVIGRRYTRTYTLTRTSGPTRAVRHEVSWLGNDGTFSARRQVNLPLNEPVDFTVRVNPRTAGAHSAILRLDDPGTWGIDLMTMNLVVAADEFTAAKQYRVNYSGRIGRNDTQRFFVRVPDEASALKVDMDAGGAQPGKGQVRFLRYTPQGLGADSNSSINCFNPDAGGGCSTGSPISRTVVDPMPGVWELVVEARRTSDALEAPFSLAVTVLGTEVSPNPDVVDSLAIGEPTTRQYTVANKLAGFTGRLVGGGPLGSGRSQRPQIGHQGQETYDVTIPAGAAAFTVTTGNPADARADIDLFVYNCTSGSCVLAGASTSSSSNERVALTNPAAGLWRILVDGFSVPSGSTEYDLVDVYVGSFLGSIEATDTDAQRASGSTWSPTAVLTAGAQPGAGRQLTGQLTVRTDTGVTVGTASVIVESVTG